MATDEEQSLAMREANLQIKVLAKAALDGALEPFERGARNVGHVLRVLTGLSVIAGLILGLMLIWGLTGAMGAGWHTTAMITAYIAAAVMIVIAFVAASHIRGDLAHEIAMVQRHADGLQEEIKKASAAMP